MFVSNTSTSSMLTLEEGQSFVQERYILRRNLGGDGYGQLWLARDQQENRSLAVKFLPFSSNNHYPEFISGVKKRYRALCNLEHPHIVNYNRLERISLWGETDYLLTMDLPQGNNLRDYRNNLVAQSCFSVEKAAEICHAIAQALEYTHANNIIHYELRPENIYINNEGKVKITAFESLRKLCATTSFEAEKDFRCLQACAYLAPEQWLGWRRANEKLDQFALGVIFYELIRNQTPFTASSKEKLNISILKDSFDDLDELSPIQNRALAKALSKRPSSRFDSCLEFTRVLTGKDTKWHAFGDQLNNLFTFADYRLNQDGTEPSSCYVENETTEIRLNSLSKCELEKLAEIRTPISLDLSKTAITTLKGLKDYPNIVELKLKWCSSLTDISDLAELEDLEVLDMEACDKVTNMTALTKLKKLTELYLPNLVTDEQFNLLIRSGSCSKLKKLNFKSCSKVQNISQIDKLTSLEWLVINWCEKINSIKGISKLQNLRFLEISYCDNISDISPAGELTRLQALKICACRRIVSIRSLKTLTELTRLNLSENNNLKDISALSKMKNINRLCLAHCRKLSNITPLENLHKLELLSLGNCHNLSRIDSLARAKELKVINLGNSRKVSNITALINLKKLIRVNLEGCAKIGFMQKRKFKKLLPKCKITY